MLSKKIISLFLVFCYIINFSILSFAFNSSQRSQNVEISPIVIESNDIQDVLSTLELSRSSDIVYEMSITNIKIEKNIIDIFCTMDELKLQLKGELYRSGLDESIFVAVMEDTTKNVNILYFEISTENKSKTLFNKNYNNTPVLKLYLLDTNNNLLVIEQQLSKFSIDISSLKKLSLEIAEGIHDALWFTKILEPTETIILSSATVKRMLEDDKFAKNYSEYKDIIDNLTNVSEPSRSTTPYSWVGDLYRTTYWYGTDYYDIRAVPYFDGNIVNVGKNASSSNWTSALRIQESVQVNNQITNVRNMYNIRNAKFHVAADTGTVLTSAGFSGCYTVSQTGSIQINIFGLIGVIPNFVGTVASLLSNISYQSTNIQHNGTSFTFSPNVRSWAFNADSTIRLNNTKNTSNDITDHHISISSWASAQSGATSGSRQAGIKWTFEFWDSSGKLKEFSKEVFVSYSIV